MTTLIINDWESRCGDCGKGADPSGTYHLTPLAGSSGGCGKRFTETATHIPGMRQAVGIVRMRPDLPFTGYIGPGFMGSKPN